MKVTLYGISNCDTIKKTRKWLQDHGIEYDFHDYKKHGCTAELTEQFLKKFTVDELINRRGTTWRKLPESSRQSLDQDSAANLMQDHPSLIKRPILQADARWSLGYDEDRLQDLISKT